MLLSDFANQRLFTIVHEATDPILQWHIDQNRLCRDSDSCAKWILVQATGDFMAHVGAIMSKLWAPAAIQKCGFVVVHPLDRRVASTLEGTVAAEDDFADMYGQVHTSCSLERMKRGLHQVRGWPWAMQKFRAGDKHVVPRFEKDLAIYDEVVAMEDRCPELTIMLKRHMMKKVSVQQLTMAVRDPARTAKPAQWKKDFSIVLHDHARVTCPTQVVEDGFGAMKAAKTYKMANRVRKPERSFAKVIDGHIIDKKHKFTTPSCDVPFAGKTTRLAPSAFKQPREMRSMGWQDIVSTTSSPPYYSPKGDVFAKNIADLEFLDLCGPDKNNAKHAWLGVLAHVSHKLLAGIRQKGKLKWFHLLFHYPCSSVLVWPGQLKEEKTRFGPITYFVHEWPILEPVFMAVTDLDAVEGCCFSWKSWIWQCKNMSGAHLGKSARILPVVDIGPLPMLEVACRHAFWNLPRSVVVDFAKYANIPVVKEDKLCSVLFKVIQGVTKLSDSAVLDLLQKRLGVNDSSQKLVNALLEIDEAAVVFERMDLETLRTEQKAAATERVAEAEFASDYVDAKQRNNDAQNGKSKKGKATKREPLPGRIDQTVARTYIPPGASIWRGHGAEPTWHGHMPPQEEDLCRQLRRRGG